MMTQILSYFPGQKATVYLEVKNTDGYRVDAPELPIVTRVIFPQLTLAAGYPQNMVKIDTGLYYHQFVLPTGAVSIGSYLIDVSFINPVSMIENFQTYQIIVTAPFGNFSATVSN
jgi:hypothetical protein